MHLVADLAAEFFTTSWGKEHRRPDTDAYSGGECKNVADRMIFSRVKIFRSFAQVRDAVGGALHAIRYAIPYITGVAAGLVKEIDCRL